MSAKEIELLIRRLKTECNKNQKPTSNMIFIAGQLREQIANAIEEVVPETFAMLPDPEAREEDGFPADGNRVYHPLVDKCFHALMKTHKEVSELPAFLTQLINEGF